MPEDREFTSKEAAKYLGVSDKTVRKMAGVSGIKPHKQGQDIRYNWYYESELKKMAADRQLRLPPSMPRPTLIGLAEQVKRLQEDLATLRRQVETFHPKPPAATPEKPRNRRKKGESVPAGQVSLSNFARLHNVNAYRAAGILHLGVHAGLDQAARTRFYQRWRGESEFRRCSECPTEEGQPHG